MCGHAARGLVPIVEEVEDLDAEGWIRWCLAGLELFAGADGRPVPRLEPSRLAAERVLLELASERLDTNAGRMAAALGVTPKTCRSTLRRHDLWPLLSPPMVRLRERLMRPVEPIRY